MVEAESLEGEKWSAGITVSNAMVEREERKGKDEKRRKWEA